MTTEKQAAEQLDQYITARQKGQTGGNHALIDDLITLAESVSADEAAPRREERSAPVRPVLKPVFARLATVAAAMTLVIVVFATVPPLRAQVAALFDFFTPGSTNENPGLEPTVTPPEDAGNIAPIDRPEAQVGLSLEQVNAIVAASDEITFTVQTPDYMPDGFSYDSGMVVEFGRDVTLIYVCPDRLSDFSVSMRDLANPNPAVDPSLAQPVGADAEIVAVQVAGAPAEYVHGDFGPDGLWDNDAPVQTLSWVRGSVFYRLRSYVQDASTCSVTQEDLIAIAESID